MKSRPILFNAPMVRAVLEGSKTQTRRVLKSQALEWISTPVGFDPQFIADAENRLSPYGQIGDQLWVRETFCEVPMTDLANCKTSIFIEFAAGKKYLKQGKPPAIWDSYKPEGVKWKPSIFMPRAASRITLEITGVRVERLQDISEVDALAEGVEPLSDPGAVFAPAKSAYCDLWESINGAGSWGLNPWVWVLEFKRLKPI